jgi:beta-glucosidase
MRVSAEVDERTLHEIYLAGFERAIRKSDPWTVMCAYNRVNGIYASEHQELLTDILRDEWGYQGVMISDWGAVHHRVNALRAGLDLEMPGPQEHRAKQIVEAVQNGSLDESVLDRSVERILSLVAKAQTTPKGHTVVDVEKHHALARRVAGEAIVLLKNDGNLLPLARTGSIAVIGLSARQPHYQGGGSSHINATRVDVPFVELGKLAGDADLHFAPGYTMEEGFDQALIDEAVSIAERTNVALLFIALPPFKESEGYDRPDIDLTGQQVALIKAVSAIQPYTVVVLNNGSPVAMQEWIGDVPAVIEAWLMGQAGGGAIADVLFGATNPSGRLAETYPIGLSDTPAFTNFPGDGDSVYYGERLFIGYRYYDFKSIDVLFPFGHGLSYSVFEFSNLQLPQHKLRGNEPVTVKVDVKNTGPMAGKETVQIYVGSVKSSMTRPVKELKGFAKVTLQPGETKTVAVSLEASALSYYDPRVGEWKTENGAYEILVGRSATDISLQGKVHLQTGRATADPLGRLSTLNEWLADPGGAAVLESHLDTLLAQPDGQAMVLLGSRSYVGNIPLETLLIWFGKGLPMAPEVMVDHLLAEAGKVKSG